MNIKTLIVVLVIFSLLLAACSNSSGNKSNVDISNTQMSNTEVKSTIDTTSNSSQANGTVKITKDMFDCSEVHDSPDEARLANVMKKAQSGQPITIGVIGGSITMGQSATDEYKTYSRLVYDWWVKNFPKSKVNFVNAGVGATDSIFGVHRMGDDLLAKKPDFVIIEFGVNDAKTPLHEETYENTIRRILKEPQNPAALLLFMMTIQGGNSQKSQSLTGKHYNLPMISYKDALWPSIVDQSIKWRDISPDNIHPNNRGHEITAELINNYLDKVFNNLESISTTVKALPEPVISEKYVNAKFLTSNNITPESFGSFKIYNNAINQFKYAWTAKSGTKPIRFKIDGKNIFILIRKTASDKGAKATIKINGNKVATIDSAVPNKLGEYAESVLIFESTKSAQQIVEIQFIPDGKKNEFTILGFLVS